MLLDIVEEHLEEAEILCSRRRSALRSPTLNLAGLEALEARLHTHLDGVVLGVREIRGRLEPRLRGNDADEAFAAAAALLLGRGRTACTLVLDAIGGAYDRTGIVEALCYFPLAEEARRVLQTIVAEGDDKRLGPAIDVLSFHRLISPCALWPAVVAGDVQTRLAAARAMGRVGGDEAWNLALVNDRDEDVRDAALRAAARCGQPWALELLRSVCHDRRLITPEAIGLLACLGDRNDVGTLLGLAGRDGLSEAALAGLATLGHTECIGPMLDLATTGSLARAAAETFYRLTGLAIPAREGEPQDATEEDRVFEDLRPLPDLGATRALWTACASEFKLSQRYRHGRSLVADQWARTPHEGDLQTRCEEITRLWAARPGLFPTLELKALVARQRVAA